MRKTNKNRILTLVSLVLSFVMAVVLLTNSIAEESNNEIVDTNPAIYVTQKTAQSVVGVITSQESWDQTSREATTTAVSQGSGVVIKEGGYIITNNHVIEDGDSYQVLLPSGEKADATLIGCDESTDIAVLQCDSDELVPVSIGSSSDMPIGSTVIAIGNPGGEVLANTVTSGIISGMEREVSGSNGSTRVSYIQHDAPINSGNSGGGLFDVNGNLIGINTLKYSGSAYSSVTFEGLGFALPIDTVYPLAEEIIEYGKVRRPAMGVTVAEWSGPDEAMNSYPPASVCVYSVNEGSPAETAGLKQYDFITEIDGVRVTTLRGLITEIDKHQAGDTVTLTVLRYNNLDSLMQSSTTNDSSSYYGNFGGYYNNPFGNNSRNNRNSSGYETLTISVVLEMDD